MKFKNNGNDEKVRAGGGWITVKSGDIIDLPEASGIGNGFEKLVEHEKVKEVPEAPVKEVKKPKVAKKPKKKKK